MFLAFRCFLLSGLCSAGYLRTHYLIPMHFCMHAKWFIMPEACVRSKEPCRFVSILLS